MRAAVDYFGWFQEGQDKELGVHVVVTDKIAEEAAKYREAVTMPMVFAMARAMVESGLEPVGAKVAVEGDPALQRDDVYLWAEGRFTGKMEDYVILAHNMWQREQRRRKALESLSLWGHLRQWLRYKRGKDEA